MNQLFLFFCFLKKFNQSSKPRTINIRKFFAINQKVGFRLVTKFGEKGVINLGKAIPILGGLIGGTIDAASTHSIGKISKKVFV